MGLAKLAVADAAITFLWAVYVAFIGPMTGLLVSSFHLQGYEFYVSMGFLALNIFLFSWLGGALGGAFWNPAPVLAFYSIGASADSLFSLAVRFPAQAAGAVGGVLAARELVPSSYRQRLRGPQLQVDLSRGILSELILTFFTTFSVLVAIFKVPASKFWKTWVIIFATIGALLLGAGYTGPSMNPANAFAWAYVNNKHSDLEHLVVYWLAPLAGSFMAAWIFQLVFPRDRPKEKEA